MRPCRVARAGTGKPNQGFPDVEQTEAFLDAYRDAIGRRFGPDEVELAWAGGLWTRAFNAKKWYPREPATLDVDEAVERMRRARIELLWSLAGPSTHGLILVSL